MCHRSRKVPFLAHSLFFRIDLGYVFLKLGVPTKHGVDFLWVSLLSPKDLKEPRPLREILSGILELSPKQISKRNSAGHMQKSANHFESEACKPIHECPPIQKQPTEGTPTQKALCHRSRLLTGLNLTEELVEVAVGVEWTPLASGAEARAVSGSRAFEGATEELRNQRLWLFSGL